MCPSAPGIFQSIGVLVFWCLLDALFRSWHFEWNSSRVASTLARIHTQVVEKLVEVPQASNMICDQPFLKQLSQKPQPGRTLKDTWSLFARHV